jgi:[acyl-carrier-protein] S-malonyltransferase
MKIAFIFPGQGPQYPGMGADIAQDFPVASAVFNKIAESFQKVDPGFDLGALQTDSNNDTLMRTDVCQALVFSHSLMAWAAFEQELENGPNYSVVAALGHSFGELAAIVAARSLDLETMSEIVLRRGQLMQGGPEGRMLNIEGLDRSTLQDLIKQFDINRETVNRVYLAIQQGPRLHAVGGLPHAVLEFESFLKQRGVSCRSILGVKKALHTPFQLEIRSKFRKSLSSVSFQPLQIPVISTARGNFYASDEIADNLAAQFDCEMRFGESLEHITTLNPDIYLVFGPGSKVAELLAHYNGINSERIRVIERSKQLQKVAAEVRGGAILIGSTKSIDDNREFNYGLVRKTLRGFERKNEEYLLIERNGRVGSLATELDRSSTLIFCKGSFNPIHLGHISLLEASRRRHPGAWGTFAISVHTNKGIIERRDLLSRIKLIVRAGYPVVLSYSGYFYENVSWLRSHAPYLRIIFPIGADALDRLVDYFSPEEFAERFPGVLFEYSDRESGRLSRDCMHPAYDGIRRMELEPHAYSISSTEIRKFATTGRMNEVKARMPVSAAEEYLRNFKAKA